MSLENISEPIWAPGLRAVMLGAGKATRLLPIPQPTLLVGPGSSGRMGHSVAGFGHKKVLIVTDAIIHKLGLMNALLESLKEEGTDFEIYDEITPDAPVHLIEKGVERFKATGCDGIIAFGGGSPMDASKTMALAIANNKSPMQLVGYFKGLKTPVPIYAVPTTAGTGSEVTVAAVISDPETHRKLVIADTRVVPKVAALDPSIMTGLPKPITAATGMDALTHALEAYLGNWTTDTTNSLAISAINMIFGNLRTAYNDGKNLVARENMALASTYAGMAFTRANVGYVHAIAHQMGGKYGTPHGLANAIFLPYVLRFSRPAIEDRLAYLAVQTGIGKGDEGQAQLADKFLDAVEQLNQDVGIPTVLDALREEDIPNLAKGASKEAYTSYPVPRYMSVDGCAELIRCALPKAA